MIYRVTAEDGSYSEYTVTVMVSAIDDKDIISLSITGQTNSVISGTGITVTVPYGTDKTSLSPDIIHTGVSISPESGVSGDFTNPVTYTVTDGTGDTKEYTVTVLTYVKTFGETNADWGHGTCTDSLGNVYIAGNFYGTADFGGGPVVSNGQDAFLVKYSKNGSYLWARTFGMAGSSSGWHSICTDLSGNIYVAGIVSGDNVDLGGVIIPGSARLKRFVAKYAPDGSCIWAKTTGVGTTSVAVDSSGNVFTAGRFTGTEDFGGGNITSNNQDGFLTKYAPDGSYLWTKTTTGSGNESVNSVAADSAGNIYISGDFSGTANLGGGDVLNSSGFDAFIAKYSSNGTWLWQKIFTARNNHSDTGRATARSLKLDPSGNVYVAGECAGFVDLGDGEVNVGNATAYVVKYTHGGLFLWSKVAVIGISGGSFRNISIDVDASGNSYIAGNFRFRFDFGGGNIFPANGEYSACVVKFDADGVYKWAKPFAHNINYTHMHNAICSSITVGISGNIYTTGAFQRTVDFGNGDFTASTSKDFFLIQVLNE